MKFILSADWHARGDRPRCRIDGGADISDESANQAFIQFQNKCFEFIVDKSNQLSAPLVIVGDLLHKSHIPDSIKNILLDNLLKAKNGVYLLWGNHDLYGHSFSEVYEGSAGTFQLLLDGKIFHDLEEFGQWAHFGTEEKDNDGNRNMLFTHRLVFSDNIPPNVEAITAKDLLKLYPNKKWIFTGDMHKSFHYEWKGRHVVNPGCINRQTADMKDYRPIIYYIDTEKETAKEIYIPDNSPMVDDSYLKTEEERNDRIEAFVDRIKNNSEISLDFKANLEKAMEENKKILGSKVIEMIQILVEQKGEEND